MVVLARRAGTSSGFRMRPAVQFVPVPVGFHALSTVPTGVYQTKNRLGDAVAAARAPVGRMASRKGNPRVNPEAARNRVRLLRGLKASLLGCGGKGTRGSRSS